MIRRVAVPFLLPVALIVALAQSRSPIVLGAAKSSPAGWNKQAAAAYLDSRQLWWQTWPKAQRDHGTICISCHTQLPYALLRPTLGRDLGEPNETAAQQTLMRNLEQRVSHWSEMEPFYSDAKSGPGKTVESHATEAVLNATILAGYDASHGHLRPITRTAFNSAWQLQQQSGNLAGAWQWQDFHLGPWEASESGYQGAALLMVQALNAPDGFANEPEVRRHLDRVRGFLRTHYAAQPLVNRLYILWASAKEPTLLTPDQRTDLPAELRRLQQADGGWRTSALDKKDRSDHSPEPTDSDGYATGLAVLALESSGTPRSDQTLQRGLQWLTTHQRQDGTWYAASINKLRDPKSDPAPFMTDAATAYAALALENQR
jgi:squalene-hopene/tetraprenyl-beta-curcumene cyclase